MFRKKRNPSTSNNATSFSCLFWTLLSLLSSANCPRELEPHLSTSPVSSKLFRSWSNFVLFPDQTSFSYIVTDLRIEMPNKRWDPELKTLSGLFILPISRSAELPTGVSDCCVYDGRTDIALHVHPLRARVLNGKPIFNTFWYRILKYSNSDFQGEKTVWTFLNVENHREARNSPSGLASREIHPGTKTFDLFSPWTLLNLISLW